MLPMEAIAVRKAERLGAEVALLESPRMVEVSALADRRWPMALACSRG